MSKPLRTGMPVADDAEKRRPVDRVAARVIGWRGSHFGFVNATDEVCISTPLPTRPVPRDMPNYLGVRNDRLVVVGLTTTASNGGASSVDPLRRKQTKRQDANARWLCRCDCGMYCLRSSRAVRERRDGLCVATHIEACFQCRQLDKVRHGDMTPIEYARNRKSINREAANGTGSES